MILYDGKKRFVFTDKTGKKKYIRINNENVYLSDIKSKYKYIHHHIQEGGSFNKLKEYLLARNFSNTEANEMSACLQNIMIQNPDCGLYCTPKTTSQSTEFFDEFKDCIPKGKTNFFKNGPITIIPLCNKCLITVELPYDDINEETIKKYIEGLTDAFTPTAQIHDSANSISPSSSIPYAPLR